ncbi:hypothetical protein HOY82DRAFT_604937 [Tuber indicum]|nr:hypothetical protein HOY82DRAFT_604937 [Tuber indicum]
MSPVSAEDFLLETFDSPLEQEDYVFPDSELLLGVFDQGQEFSAARHAGINFACPSGAYSHELQVGPGCSESPESNKTEPTDKNVVANVEKKKRKSWGQELPIPTTNLPPRKRAKTEEEKEQRRIERILRNRAAARSSRERKENQIEALKEEWRGLAEGNASLRDQLTALEESNKALRQQLGAMEETVKRYEEQMKVVASDCSTNATARPAHPKNPTSFWGGPGQSFSEQERHLCFLDTIEQPPATTIDPSVLGGPIEPYWGEAVIGSGRIIS